MLSLRDYQEKAVSSIMDYLYTKKGNPVLDACVGSGKSLMIAETVIRIIQADPNARLLMLTHVKELIEQNYEKLKEQAPFCDAGIYSASVGQKKANNQITYAGIQSVHKKPNQIGFRNIILIDEAHLISPEAETMYRKFINAMRAINPKLRVIGFTGTAYRSKDGLITEGKNALFDEVCHQVSMIELIKKGYLMPLVSKPSIVQADMSKVKTIAGDFSKKGMQEALDKEILTQQAIDEVERWASNRRCGLFFCSGVEHALHVRDELHKRGYTAETITGSTPKLEREKILDDFRAGKIRYLTNDSVLTTGTDVPMLDLIVLLRGTKSPVLYTQILGRGVRCFGKDAEESIRNGKKDCMVLDFAGNIERFGAVDQITFKPKKEKGEVGIIVTPSKACPNLDCREPNPISARFCALCGEAYPEMERNISHDTQASDGAILSTDIKPKYREVTRTIFNKHKNKNGGVSLRVSYFKGLKIVAKEFVPVENEKARFLANKWFNKFYKQNAPTTVDEALEFEPPILKGVWLTKNKNGYEEVTSYEQ